MWFAKPDLDFSNAYAEQTPLDPANEASFLDVMKASRESMRYGYNISAGTDSLSDVYDRHIAKVKEITGKELVNPESDRFWWGVSDPNTRRQINDAFDAYRTDGGDQDRVAFTRRWQEDQFRKQLEELRAKFPDRGEEILPEVSFRQSGHMHSAETERAAAETAQRYRGWMPTWTAEMLGGLWGTAYDPINILTLPLGPSGAGLGARGILVTALKAGATNAAIEAGVQPFVQDYRRQAGLSHGVGDAATAIGSAFLFGGLIDAGVRSASRGVRLSFGYAPIVRDGIVVGWHRTPLERLEAGAMPALPNLPEDLVKRAATGDDKAQAEIARIIDTHAKPGTVVSNRTMAEAASGDLRALEKIYGPEAKNDPIVRQAIDTARADELLTIKPHDGIDDVSHAATVAQAVRHVNDPDTEPFPARIDTTEPTPGFDRAAIETQLSDLRGKLDAKPDNAELQARIADLEAQVNAVDRFGDDPLAASLVIRDNAGRLPPGVDPGDTRVRTARALASLSGEAFGMVREKKASPELGQVVADFVGTKEQQAPILADLVKMQPVSADEARQMVGELLRSPEYGPRTQELVGPASDSAQSPRLLDDPYGAEAKAQVARLEQDAAEELASGGRYPDPVAPLLTPEGQTAAASRASQVEAIVSEMSGIVPQGFDVRVFSSMDDLPADLRVRVKAANAEAFASALKRFQEAASLNDRARARADLDAASRGEGIEGFANDATIWIAAYAMNPKARMAHEVVHALRTAGRLSPEEIRVLADAAREAGAWNEVREAMYRAELERRFGTDSPRVAEILEEEAAAHYVDSFVRDELPGPPSTQAVGIIARVKELFQQIRSALVGQGFRSSDPGARIDPAQEVVAALLAGKIARSEQNIEWMRVRSNEMPGTMGQHHGLDPVVIADIQSAAQKIGDELSDLASGVPRLGRDGDGNISSVAYNGQTYTVKRSDDGSIESVGVATDGKPSAMELRPDMIDQDKAARIMAPVQELVVKHGGKIDPQTASQIVQRVVSDVAGGEPVQDAIAREVSNQIAQPMNSPEDRYINRMRAGGSEKSDDELRAIYRAKVARQNTQFAMRSDMEIGQSMRRDLDRLGYFSGALEAAKRLRQAKGTPEQMLAMLKKEGAKDAEIEATGLREFLGRATDAGAAGGGRPSAKDGALSEGRTAAQGTPNVSRNQITKSDIIKYLEDNRVVVQEVERGLTREQLAAEARMNELSDQMQVIQREDYKAVGEFRDEKDIAARNPAYGAIVKEYDDLSSRNFGPDRKANKRTKWSPYSLDPSNPTYRETVLHLPPTASEADMDALRASADRGEITSEQFRARRTELEQAALQDFRSGHFPEPNIVGHMMTSMVKHEGKATYLVDQIQSDWGQKLRDRGVRDEAKIAELKSKIVEAKRQLPDQFEVNAFGGRKIFETRQQAHAWILEKAPKQKGFFAKKPEIRDDVLYLPGVGKIDIRAVVVEHDDVRRLRAELRTAEAATPGHPLVNTTDQWVNTTLRRAIRQAVEADAEYIAIPHGDTVLSYNPGDLKGMREFYGVGRVKDAARFEAAKREGKQLSTRLKEIEVEARKFPRNSYNRTQLDNEKFEINKRLREIDDVISSEASRPDGNAMGIVPKNLRNLLQKIDKESPPQIFVKELETSSGLQSHNPSERGSFNRNMTGFTLFKLTDKVKQSVIEDGQPMFAMRDSMLAVRDGATIHNGMAIFDEILENPSKRDMLGLLRRVAKYRRPDEKAVLRFIFTYRSDNFIVQDAAAGTHFTMGGEPVGAGWIAADGTAYVRRFSIDDDLTFEAKKGFLADITGKEPVFLTQREFEKLNDEQPLFAMRSQSGRMKPGAMERAKNLETDLKDIENALAGAAMDDRAALQAKRAALINNREHERLSDEVASHRTVRGVVDEALGFLRAHETFGRGGFKGDDLASLKNTIMNEALEKLAGPVWYFRKGAITGDFRRTLNKSVNLTMKDMIREAAGENTGNAQARIFAKAWADTAEWLRQSFNAAGGDIGKLKGWFAPQYHNPEALLRAGRDKWVKYLSADGMLDRERMVKRDGTRLNDKELETLLQDIWSTITSDGANKLDELPSFQGKGALYKRHSEHRVLHFKNADAFLKYANDFGSADTYAMMIGHVSMMARDIAALRRFGANPEVVRTREKARIRANALMARSAQSIMDEFRAKIAELQATKADMGTTVDGILQKMETLHAELDAIRGKARHAERRTSIDAELYALHDELRKGIEKGPLSPDQVKITQDIAAMMDEMQRVQDTFSVVSRDPVQRTERLLARADEVWKLYTGTTNTPLDYGLAAGMQGFRNVVSSSVLAGASISALSDQATGLAARLFVGMPVTNQLYGFVKAFSKGSRQDALALSLGLDQAHHAFAMQSRFAGWINTRSITGYLADRTHAFSMLSPMTQAAKTGFGWDFVVWMAKLAKAHSFESLEPWTRDMLVRHGWTPNDWTALRGVTPESIRGVPVLSRRVIAAQAGDDLADKYMRVLLRERAMAVLEPTLEGRALWVSESRPGTIMGEITRSVAMVKSFPTTYATLILGRAYDQFLEGNLGRKNTLAYGAAILFGGTVLGALVRQLKDIAYGKDPEDMREPKFWGRAFMQSGGFGIFGDFISNSTNRFGGGLAQTLMGPATDRASNLFNLTFGNAFQYAADEPTNFGREAVTALRQNTPVLPFYLRLAYDRMILDEFQKRVDPGSYRSFRSRIHTQKKLGGNDYYWPPGSFYAPRGPDYNAAFGR